MAVIVVVPPVCAYRHDCAHVSGGELIVITIAVLAAIAVLWGLMALAAWLCDWWCDRCRRDRISR